MLTGPWQQRPKGKGTAFLWFCNLFSCCLFYCYCHKYSHSGHYFYCFLKGHVLCLTESLKFLCKSKRKESKRFLGQYINPSRIIISPKVSSHFKEIILFVCVNSLFSWVSQVKISPTSSLDSVRQVTRQNVLLDTHYLLLLVQAHSSPTIVEMGHLLEAFNRTYQQKFNPPVYTSTLQLQWQQLRFMTKMENIILNHLSVLLKLGKGC